jgi:hypothetical protein
MEKPFKLTRRNLRSALFGVRVSSTLPVPSRSRAQQGFELTVDASHVIGPCDPTLWANIGYDPMYVLTIKARSELQTLGPPIVLPVEAGQLHLAFELPVNAVSLIVCSSNDAAA